MTRQQAPADELLPPGPMAIGQILAWQAQHRADVVAVRCGEEQVTYAELEAAARRFARVLLAHGVAEGDYVAVDLPNSVSTFIALGGAWMVGAVPFVVPHGLSDGERFGLLALVAPAVLVGGRPWPDTDVVHLPGVDGPDADDEESPLPERISPAWRAVASGGSTGVPKVIVSGRSGLMDPRIGDSVGMRSDDVQLVGGPLYHSSPMMYAAYGLFLGHQVVVLPRFDAAAALQEISRRRVTWLCVVPTMMNRMLAEVRKDPVAHDLSSIRAMWHMAAPCPAALKLAWIDLLGPDRVMELYGSTEAQEAAVISGGDWLVRPGSVGRPRGGGGFAILDEMGEPAPAGEVGNIYVRRAPGSPPTYRYLGAPPARSLGEWESVGDVGWMDDDGWLYISDRRADLIISGGANIYPAEIEAAAEAHPEIRSAVAVGLPDDDLGQRVHLLVETDQLSEADVTEHLTGLLARYKRPRSVEIVATSLRNDAGKTRRGRIRDMVIARGETQSVAASNGSSTATTSTEAGP